VALKAGRWTYRPSSSQWGYTDIPETGDVWLSCQQDCSVVEVHEEGGRIDTATLPSSMRLNRESPRFSSDGRRYAMTGTRTDDGSPTLIVIDRADGRSKVLSVAASADLAWTPDGTQLLLALHSDSNTKRRVGRYDVRTGRWEETTVDVPGLLNLVVVEREFGPALLDGPRRSPGDCPPPEIYPSGREPACGFTLP
jgi:hypothetical protein